MDNAYQLADRAYRELLDQYLRLYASGAPRGRQLERPCGHWAWELCFDIPCVTCYGNAADMLATG